MTIQQAIDRADRLRPNQYTTAEKTAWLSALDARIRLELIDTHCGAPETPFEPYDNKRTDAALLVEPPYDDLYEAYLASKIDYGQADFARYNNDAAMFNMRYAAYATAYHRAHQPVAGRLSL